MAFKIKSLDSPVEELCDEKIAWCEIEIGSFSERFAAPLDKWSLCDYAAQWQVAIKSIVEGSLKNYLVAAMRDPKNSDFLSFYSLYREDGEVFVQNQIVLCEGNEQLIMSGELIELIEDRETETEDGEAISEWKISLEELESFLQITS